MNVIWLLFEAQILDAIAAEKAMSELEFNGTASVEFTTSLGSKARIEITGFRV